MSHEITIRRASTFADYRACQDAQRLAWGLTDERDIVPVATMVGANHHGGFVLGAFLADGAAVGLSVAFLGRVEGRLCLYSQLTGVAPGFQDQGIGFRLKTAQRDFTRHENIPCIAWAFDPLQAGNARFNLDKLGATVGRYLENMYGPRTDALHHDAPTDRLIAVWETTPAPRPEPPSFENLPRAIDPDPPTFAGFPADAPRFLLEIPADVKGLRSGDPDQAALWSSAVRQAFLAAFGAGYRAVGFFREGRRGFYLLERAGRPDVL